MQTKSKGKKNVVILSTTRPMHCCANDDNKSKPQIFKFCDFTKGGTDIFDQMNIISSIFEVGNNCSLLHAGHISCKCKNYLVYKKRN